MEPENLLYKWTFHRTYFMSYCGRKVALTVWIGVTKEQGVTAFYTEGISIHFPYSAFCIRFMHIIGRTDLINFRCLAILLAQKAGRYVKQSKQSALISSNVACCCWDIPLIELSEHCYCCHCSNIHQLTHKHNHSTVLPPSHTVLSAVSTVSRLQKGIQFLST